MSKQTNLVTPVNPMILGKLGSAYGIHGWLKVFSFTERPESIFFYQPCFIYSAGQWKHIKLIDWKHHNKNIIVKLSTVNNREQAIRFTNFDIIIDSIQLPKLGNNEYYWKDLIGCHVVTLQGYDLGSIVDMIKTGSNDVMVINTNLKDMFGIQERLIPFLHGRVIQKVDLSFKLVEVNWDPSF
ncbi:Ribosome maturation factor RimM [Candidatus Hartigia pinicola]|nr:Ribosome maturation factor RimM [Candidatus Hartigia pinicola]